MGRGGFRVGSGRKKGEETKVIRIPIALEVKINKLISEYKNTASEPPCEPVTASEPPCEPVTASEPPCEPVTASEPPCEPVTASEPPCEPVTASISSMVMEFSRNGVSIAGQALEYFDSLESEKADELDRHDWNMKHKPKKKRTKRKHKR